MSEKTEDTPMDLSNVKSMSDEEYEAYWEQRKREIDEEVNQK